MSPPAVPTRTSFLSGSWEVTGDPSGPGWGGGQASVTREARLRRYAWWFIHMRWVVTALAVIVIVIAIEVGHLLPPQVFWPLISTLVALGTFNWAYGAALRAGWRVGPILAVQVYADLLFLTVILHYSGGMENPIALLVCLNVILAGIVLSRARCFTVALAASGSLAVLAWAEWAHALPHYTLGMFPHGHTETIHAAYDAAWTASWTGLHVIVCLLTAHFVSRLADEARAHEERLVAAAEGARTQQELLEQALENTRTGLRVLGRDLGLQWVNDQWRRWFPAGGSAEAGFFAWARAESSDARATLTDGQVRAAEYADEAAESVAEPGRAFLVITAPLHDGQEHITRVVQLAQDITGQKKAQAHMLRACKLAAVGEIAGQLAHEVNNPVSIISTKARLLLSDRRPELSERAAREVEKIVHLAERVARLAQGLLSYGRPAAGPRAPLDVRTPVQRALSLVGEQAARQGVRLVDQTCAGLALVEANAAELEQVFLNLLLNALDAMPAGGVLTAWMPAHPARFADGRATVEAVIGDTGAGIPREIQDRIFEPFFTTKEEGRGTGLGLSVCYGIVRSHGGEILVESKPAAGARFSVRLPVAPGRNGGSDDA